MDTEFRQRKPINENNNLVDVVKPNQNVSFIDNI